MAYRKPEAPRPERDRRPVVRMPDAPDDLELAAKAESIRQIREESAQLAEALEEERRRFDRTVRIGGVVAIGASCFLAMLGPLSGRAAMVAGAGFLAGLLAALIGGQGGTRPETMPGWAKSALAGAAIVGMILGAGML